MNRRNPRRHGHSAALAAVLMIAGLGSAQSGAPAPPRGESEPLRGALHLRIDDPANPRRRNLRLDQADALPLKAHDRFRIEAKLNRPAYLYLFWIGSDGKVAPIYPWAPGHWERRPAAENKTDQLDLPSKADKAWEIPEGDAGLEALVLLAREDSPLPRDVDLTRLLAGQPAHRSPDIEKAVWIENGREVTLDSHARTVPSPKSRKSDDPVLRFRRLLQEKVQPLGGYSQAVLFSNQGGKRMDQ